MRKGVHGEIIKPRKFYTQIGRMERGKNGVGSTRSSDLRVLGDLCGAFVGTLFCGGNWTAGVAETRRRQVGKKQGVLKLGGGHIGIAMTGNGCYAMRTTRDCQKGTWLRKEV